MASFSPIVRPCPLKRDIAGDDVTDFPQCGGPNHELFAAKRDAGGVCQPSRPPGNSNPVSCAVAGKAAGAASGYAIGGPIGAVIGGSIGTANGTVTGTANILSPPACAPGYMYYNGACYPAR